MKARRPRRPPIRSTAVFYVLAAAFVTLAGYHLFHGSGPSVATGAESALVCVFAATTGYVGVWFDRSNLTDADGRSLLFYTGVFGGLGLAIATTIVFIGMLKGNPPGDQLFTLTLGAATGITAGAYAGMYYQQLRRQFDEIEQLNARLQVLQRVLRHNLRNDLTVVSGHVDLLERTSNDDERDELVGVLQRRLEKLLELSEKATTIESIWKVDGELVVRDLVPLVRRRVDDLRTRYPDVTVTVDAPETATAAVHPYVGAAVRELLENTCEHNDPAAISLSVTVTDDPDGVTISVADTGVGIPNGEVAALDRPMETPLTHASGLGLWLVYWVVDLSDGALDVHANEPTGSVVELRFPRRTVDDTVASERGETGARERDARRANQNP